MFVVQSANRAALGRYAALDQHGEKQRLLLAVMELVCVDAQELHGRHQHGDIGLLASFHIIGNAAQSLDHAFDEAVLGVHDLCRFHFGSFLR